MKTYWLVEYQDRDGHHYVDGFKIKEAAELFAKSHNSIAIKVASVNEIVENVLDICRDRIDVLNESIAMHTASENDAVKYKFAADNIELCCKRIDKFKKKI